MKLKQVDIISPGVITDFPFKSIGLTVQARDREGRRCLPKYCGFFSRVDALKCPENRDELMHLAGAAVGRANCQGVLYIPERFQVWI